MSTRKETDPVTIACFGGFWGDSMALAVEQFLRSMEHIDYLVADYLAEVTMCILAKRSGKQARYMDDFVHLYTRVAPTLQERGIRVVVNAGGLDPVGLKVALEKIHTEKKWRGTIAAVTGDAVGAAQLTQFIRDATLKPFAVDGGGGFVEPMPSANDEGRLRSCNVYLGCDGIVHALRRGANVVVTGRCVDSALIVGPCAFEWGWNLNATTTDALNCLAGATVAGHAVECGAQCCGGNFTDWELAAGPGSTRRVTPLFSNMAFPLVRVYRDGTSEIFKTQGTAGVISPLSVAEQLVYEIGDPASYSTPNVVCDFRQVRVKQVKQDVVRISGAVGKPPPPTLKMCATYADGYITTLLFVMAGVNARAKAAAVVGSVIDRGCRSLRRRGIANFSQVHVEYIGAGALHHDENSERVKEVVVRIALRHPTSSTAALDVAAQIPSASTGMAPGLMPLTTGRVAASEAVELKSALLPRHVIPVKVLVGGSTEEILKVGEVAGIQEVITTFDIPPLAPPTPTTIAPLIMIACCRSGDKGNNANIGVVARSHEYFSFLVTNITAARIRQYLGNFWFERADATVTRHLLPGLSAINFVLTNVLGGGGLSSLKLDKQGKSLGSFLLDLQLPIPTVWVHAFENGVGKAKRQFARSLL